MIRMRIVIFHIVSGFYHHQPLVSGNADEMKNVVQANWFCIPQYVPKVQITYFISGHSGGTVWPCRVGTETCHHQPTSQPEADLWCPRQEPASEPRQHNAAAA